MPPIHRFFSDARKKSRLLPFNSAWVQLWLSTTPTNGRPIRWCSEAGRISDVFSSRYGNTSASKQAGQAAQLRCVLKPGGLCLADESSYTRATARQFVYAVVYHVRTGCRWRNLPEQFGP
ncbi:transposase [Hymenobacter rigui]|uniref:Transposase n=1 Tax=Hymenobacter rigui TaxID=334424 RepID=A0A428KCF2_9BACT|nr:transposase [Hymenobacter rigui]